MIDLLIVTGASKGIGANIVANSSDICKNMIVTASSDKIYDVNVTNKNCNLIKLKLDLQNYDLVYKTITDTVLGLKPINSIGIVLCGASIGEYGGLFDTDLSDWEKLYKCNVLGNLAVIKGCKDIIKSGAKTRIVFFGGGGAAYGYLDFFGYALSKVAVVRAVENLSIELEEYDSSIIALAPGAVATDILDKVILHGGFIKTRTDISEPTNFVYKFITDELPVKELNGKFLHVRDDIQSIDFSTANTDIFKLRRIQ